MILRKGQPLKPVELDNAKLIGVIEPEKIRILVVDEIAGPKNPMLRKLAEIVGVFGPGIQAISYRYGIAIRRDQYPDDHLVAHECVHTFQYERLGGLVSFLREYLSECHTIGYPAGPLEQEAITCSARFGKNP
ncbi:MAG: hypothetical protein P1V20_16055 [Verrucomicrobiales bacterium]|nr:hypothetical protein [Verrucomicrobiales bacterium]